MRVHVLQEPQLKEQSTLCICGGGVGGVMREVAAHGCGLHGSSFPRASGSLAKGGHALPSPCRLCVILIFLNFTPPPQLLLQGSQSPNSNLQSWAATAAARPQATNSMLDSLVELLQRRSVMML